MTMEMDHLSDGRIAVNAKQLLRKVMVSAWAEIYAVNALKIAQERIEDLDKQSGSKSFYSLGSIESALKRFGEIEK